MKRPRWDRQQLTIDWTAAAPPPVPMGPTEDGTAETAPEPVPGPVQVLPWDFQTTFPPVLQDAIDEGVVTEEDAEPGNLPGLHAEHGASLRQALVELDAVHDARRRGVDPATGKVPRKGSKRAALPTKLSHEIARLEQWWTTLLDTYEAAFGEVAAKAFGNAIHATHAGIAVVVDVTKTVTGPTTTLPEPIALRSAVKAGVFGHDENGAVDPGPEEVEEITQAHAETLTGLVDAFRHASRPMVDQAAKDLQEGVAMYAADFGQPAADQLLAYCRRRAVLE